MFRNVQPEKSHHLERRGYRSVNIGAMLSALTPIGEDGVRVWSTFPAERPARHCRSTETYLPPFHIGGTPT